MFIPHSKLIENTITSTCLGNFQQSPFFVLKMSNKIHVDPYVFLLSFVRANLPWNKLWNHSLGTKYKWKEGKIYNNYHSLVFPTAILTAVSRPLQRKTPWDRQVYFLSFFRETMRVSLTSAHLLAHLRILKM